MLTALGQSDDQQRADKLGADAYLVKSQVTLEDIVKVAQRLLGVSDETETETPALVAPEPIAAPVVPIVPTPVVAEALVAPVEPVIALPIAELATPEPISAPLPEPATTPVVEPAVTLPVLAVTPEPVGVTPPLTLDLPPLDPPAPTSTPVTTVPDAVASADESATILDQIEQFEATEATAPLEVTPVEAPTETNLDQPAEQFLTTAEPDLTSSVPVTDQTVSRNNEDVLNTALADLTGLPAIPGQEPAPDANATEALAPGNTAVQRGGGRVIAPIQSVPKPDLKTLLSLEEAKEQATGTTITPVASPAPAIIQPQPAPGTTPAPGQAIDPNSIAL